LKSNNSILLEESITLMQMQITHNKMLKSKTTHQATHSSRREKKAKGREAEEFREEKSKSWLKVWAFHFLVKTTFFPPQKCHGFRRGMIKGK
jgi:hypothetical protein